MFAKWTGGLRCYLQVYFLLESHSHSPRLTPTFNCPGFQPPPGFWAIAIIFHSFCLLYRCTTTLTHSVPGEDCTEETCCIQQIMAPPQHVTLDLPVWSHIKRHKSNSCFFLSYQQPNKAAENTETYEQHQPGSSCSRQTLTKHYITRQQSSYWCSPLHCELQQSVTLLQSVDPLALRSRCWSGIRHVTRQERSVVMLELVSFRVFWVAECYCWEAGVRLSLGNTLHQVCVWLDLSILEVRSSPWQRRRELCERSNVGRKMKRNWSGIFMFTLIAQRQKVVLNRFGSSQLFLNVWVHV